MSNIRDIVLKNILSFIKLNINKQSNHQFYIDSEEYEYHNFHIVFKCKFCHMNFFISDDWDNINNIMMHYSDNASRIDYDILFVNCNSYQENFWMPAQEKRITEFIQSLLSCDEYMIKNII